MTGAEVTVFQQSAATLISTIRSVVKIYRQTSVVNRGELAVIREHTKLALAMAHGHALGQLARVHLNEIGDTQHLIDSYSQRGAGPVQIRAMMSQLEILSQALDDNMRKFNA